MDKKKLNNEIICCRAAVRKARVAVIRKLIKKIKILKTCKLEGVKDKKLRKSERLLEKIQIMKKLKDDEVTKFALRNQDVEIFLREPGSDLKLNALASLAKHDAVVKKVNTIKGQFSEWEKELPVLLNSLEKKRKEMVDSKKNIYRPVENKKGDFEKIKKVESATKSNPKMITANKVQQKQNHSHLRKRDSDEIAESFSERMDSIEKIEDSFFIEKKVIAPKLLAESSSSQKSDNKTKFSKNSLQKSNTKNRRLHEKTVRTKKDISKIKAQKPATANEKDMLHPSWAAKKEKLIKPFQGKKIIFSDD